MNVRCSLILDGALQEVLALFWAALRPADHRRNSTKAKNLKEDELTNPVSKQPM